MDRCVGRRCRPSMRTRIDVIRRSKTTPVHELERYTRCKDCSLLQGYPYKRSHLVALRAEKISALHPLAV